MQSRMQDHKMLSLQSLRRWQRSGRHLLRRLNVDDAGRASRETASWSAGMSTGIHFGCDGGSCELGGERDVSWVKVW